MKMCDLKFNFSLKGVKSGNKESNAQLLIDRLAMNPNAIFNLFSKHSIPVFEHLPRHDGTLGDHGGPVHPWSPSL